MARFAVLARFAVFGRDVLARRVVLRFAETTGVVARLATLLRGLDRLGLRFETAPFACKASDIPIRMPLASVAKFCVRRCAVLNPVSRCLRKAICARFAKSRAVAAALAPVPVPVSFFFCSTWAHCAPILSPALSADFATLCSNASSYRSRSREACLR